MCRYAQYGEVSTKIDVYAFGVVLYELISAREAIGKSGEISTGTLGIVAMVISRSSNLGITYMLPFWKFHYYNLYHYMRLYLISFITGIYYAV